MRPEGRKVWWIALAWLLPWVGHAEFEVFKRDVDVLTSTVVRATSAIERVPSRGFLPVKISIHNGYPNPLEWTVTFRSQPQYGNGGIRFLSTHRVRTPALSDTEHAFVVPLATKLDRSVESELQISVRSGRLSAQGNLPGMLNTDWKSVAFSKGLTGLNNLDQLTKVVESRGWLPAGGQPMAAVFHPGELPADWRVLSGFDVVLLSRKEWEALEPAARETFAGWVRLGGHLHLFGTEETPFEKSGMGRIHHWSWDGLKIPPERVVASLETAPSLIRNLREGYLGNPLQKVFGEKDFNPWVVFLILLAFVIVVGPVNLKVWAGPGRRHLLFVTTPLISLSASLILLVIILLGDGFGGIGRRVGFILLRSQPEERVAHLVQEQITRTGVLLGRGFAVAEQAWFMPVIMGKSRWTHFDDPYAIEANFQQMDGQLGGDWFRSRSEQLQVIRAALPTRSRIEEIEPGKDGQAPRLFNSLGYGLVSFHYRDRAGVCWRSAGPVASGQPIVLKPVDSKENAAAWKSAQALFSAGWEEKIATLVMVNHQFLAEVEVPGAQLLPSLRSIRWERDRLMVSGEPVNRTAAAP
ncbi:MAG: hypothetical protein KGS60_15295 [Verrucomicrobia bacterium]|nr:hypothetical protein [Verrucomicrobiota bacterium]